MTEHPEQAHRRHCLFISHLPTEEKARDAGEISAITFQGSEENCLTIKRSGSYKKSQQRKDRGFWVNP